MTQKTLTLPLVWEYYEGLYWRLTLGPWVMGAVYQAGTQWRAQPNISYLPWKWTFHLTREAAQSALEDAVMALGVKP